MNIAVVIAGSFFVVVVLVVIGYLLYNKLTQSPSLTLQTESPKSDPQGASQTSNSNTQEDSQTSKSDTSPKSPLDDIPVNNNAADNITNTTPGKTPAETSSTTPATSTTSSSSTSTPTNKPAETSTAPATTAPATTTPATTAPTPPPVPLKIYQSKLQKPDPQKQNQVFGINTFDIQCKDQINGAYINGIYVNSGKYVDAVGILCSDGSKFEPKGGSQGYKNPISYSSDLKGFNKIAIKSGDYIDNITFYDVSPSANLTHVFGGTSGGNPQTIQCPSGQRLSGLSGNYNDYLRYLEGTCTDIEPTLK